MLSYLYMWPNALAVFLCVLPPTKCLKGSCPTWFCRTKCTNCLYGEQLTGQNHSEKHITVFLHIQDLHGEEVFWKPPYNELLSFPTPLYPPQISLEFNPNRNYPEPRWARFTQARLMEIKVKWWSEVAQSCPTLCDPMDCSPQAPQSVGFSRHEYWSGLLFPSPGESSRPRDWTQVSRIVGRCFTVWATREIKWVLNETPLGSLGPWWCEVLKTQVISLDEFCYLKWKSWRLL